MRKCLGELVWGYDSCERRSQDARRERIPFVLRFPCVSPCLLGVRVIRKALWVHGSRLGQEENECM